MFFFAAIVVLMITSLIGIQLAHLDGRLFKTAGILYQLAVLLACAAISQGAGIFENSATGIHPGQFNWSVPLFFASGLTLVLVCGWAVISRIRNIPDRRFVLSVCAVFVGLYVCFAVADHWYFYRGTGDNVGVAAAKALGADDVNCAAGMVLVRIEQQSARYRCPQSAVWGRYSDQPFVPWPTYQEGNSLKLKAGIENIMKNVVVGR